MKTLAKKLVDLRAKIAKIDADYEKKTAPLKEERDTLQAQILEALKEQEQFSARFDFATITRAVRRTPQITNEEALVKHFKKSGLTDYISETVNEFGKNVVKEVIKTGDTLPGVEISEKEYISVNTSSQKEDKRKVVVE